MGSFGITKRVREFLRSVPSARTTVRTYVRTYVAVYGSKRLAVWRFASDSARLGSRDDKPNRGHDGRDQIVGC